MNFIVLCSFWIWCLLSEWRCFLESRISHGVWGSLIVLFELDSLEVTRRVCIFRGYCVTYALKYFDWLCVFEFVWFVICFVMVGVWFVFWVYFF